MLETNISASSRKFMIIKINKRMLLYVTIYHILESFWILIPLFVYNDQNEERDFNSKSGQVFAYFYYKISTEK